MCDYLLQQRQLRISDAQNQSIVGKRLVGCCATRVQMRHAAPVVFLLDFDRGKHVYRVHPINVQLVADPVKMPAKKVQGCDFGLESLDKHEPRDILHCHVAERAER